MYTLNDLKKAEKDFDYWEELWIKDDIQKKTNRYTAEAKNAAQHLKKITEALKANGTIPFTDDDLAQEILDQKYPRAQSRDVVTHNGFRYQKRFYPKKRSKTGKTVKEWHAEWVNLDKPVE